ncbi:MAG: substrate-binding domain-containing protein [Deltaproteobacteria bacterium]|nr:substrate-binding domain-containing protein [Deltaproteobacteria bacterium]
MRNIRIICMLSASFLFTSPCAGRAGVLAIPGTGACEDVLKSVAAEYERSHPMSRVEIPPSVHSEGGIRQVINGETALARVSRPLTPSEAGKDLVYRVFARDAVVFAVGSSVRARSLTIPQIMGIFSGAVDRWDDLNGGKGPIRVLLREEGDASLTALRKRYAEFRDLRFTSLGKTLYHDREMAEMLQKYRNSIGFATLSSLGAANATVIPLAIDGIPATRETVSSGRYPVRIEYALVHRKDDLPPEAREFIDFLFSEAGRKVLSDNGLHPPER